MKSAGGGQSTIIHTNTGPEFLCKVILTQVHRNGIEFRLIEHRTPNQNVHIERFNRTFGDELLDAHLLNTLDDVREALRW